MDLKTAREILGLESGVFDHAIIRKAYLSKSLETHPDKIGGDGTPFKQVNEAYNFMKDVSSSTAKTPDVSMEDLSSMSYAAILARYINSYSKSGDARGRGIRVSEEAIQSLAEKLGANCQAMAERAIRGLDRGTQMKVIDCIGKCSHLFNLDSHAWINELAEQSRAQEAKECVKVVEPTLEEMLNDRVMLVEEGGETFYVPLWHEEVVFEKAGAPFIVRCKPRLPKLTYIGSDNTLHTTISVKASQVIKDGQVCFELGGKAFEIQGTKLRMVRSQTYTIPSAGLLVINPEEPLCTTGRADVCVSLIME